MAIAVLMEQMATATAAQAGITGATAVLMGLMGTVLAAGKEETLGALAALVEETTRDTAAPTAQIGTETASMDLTMVH